MRDEAIVVLAAASSIMFSIAGAREPPELHPALENAARESLLAPSPASWRDSLKDPEARRMGSTARMITWSVCSAPSSGSALSIYSIHEKAARFAPASALRDDVDSDLCGDDDQ
jgi:hypothetical protein